MTKGGSGSSLLAQRWRDRKQLISTIKWLVERLWYSAWLTTNAWQIWTTSTKKTFQFFIILYVYMLSKRGSCDIGVAGLCPSLHVRDQKRETKMRNPQNQIRKYKKHGKALKCDFGLRPKNHCWNSDVGSWKLQHDVVHIYLCECTCVAKNKETIVFLVGINLWMWMILKIPWRSQGE